MTIIKLWNKQGRCPNLADRRNLHDFTPYIQIHLIPTTFDHDSKYYKPIGPVKQIV